MLATRAFRQAGFGRKIKYYLRSAFGVGRQDFVLSPARTQIPEPLACILKMTRQLLILAVFFATTGLTACGQVLKQYGYGLVAGNQLSPFGNLGVTVNFNFLTNTEFDLGFSVVPGKVNSGIRQVIPSTGKVQPFIGCKYSRLFSYNIMFNENTPDERLYHHTAGNFINPDIGFYFFIPSKKDTRDKLIIWFSCGYSYSLTDYSITPINGYASNNFEIDKIKKGLFENGIFFNVGISANRTQKTK